MPKAEITIAQRLCTPCQTSTNMSLHPLCCAIPPIRIDRTMHEYHQYVICMNCNVYYLMVIAHHQPTGERQRLLVREDVDFKGIVPDQQIIAALRDAGSSR